MKIAVISDIHANLIALQEVLKDIEKEECQIVFCLGDIVLAGPQPKETLDFVRKQNWNIIQGNTDLMISDYNDDVKNMLTENFPIIANAVEDDILLFSDDDKEYLRSLPATLEFSVEGVNICLVHGSPRKNNEDISPNLPLDKVEEMIKPSNADLILCGHTHIPCGYQTNKKQTVINVGSVGRPMTENPLPCYLVLEINNGIFSAKHKFVDYNREAAANMLASRHFKGADKLAKLLINPISRHV